MNFRRKLLAVFALTVFLSVVAVTWIVATVTRNAFERLNEERTTALVVQFRHEFSRRGEVVQRVETVASSDSAARIALAFSQGSRDYSAYVGEAKNLSENQQLDFLEFVDADGTIISSAQWPAKFGYKDTTPPPQTAIPGAFLRQEELPEGAVLGLSAVREVKLGDAPLYVIGGRRLDKDFVAGLELPVGMRAMLYQNLGTTFSPQFLIEASGGVPNGELVAPLISRVQQNNEEATVIVHWTDDAADDEAVHAIPLIGPDKRLMAVLLVGSSQRPYIEVSRHIRSAALLVGGAGIVLAILFSGWAAARVTRPVEQLAAAAREVASGNWSTQVPVSSSDEIGQLAEAFNRMTHEMLEQKEQLVQSERVAAWRELARRLAHELKNPLFPLQLTVENLIRAREQGPQQFDEVFRESSATLLSEVANLKTIISRFSEFSRMPQPQFQRVNINELAQNVMRLFQAQLQSPGALITSRLELAESIQAIAADPDLLHRAVSNLILNAMDAMRKGGTLTLKTWQDGDRTFLEISDTGTGLSREECERLFTPYYTSKAHGTGLGLAMVQSIISDHGGRISVQSQPGQGATFVIELPANWEKLQAAGSASTTI